ncbi:hypothetical protein T265_07088 [Opisthorchis viverrini]|uniref:Uncharacterized protein n=1 Tax=Opisthorchis viverrini TaxID=6198 RepID=A0A074ZQ53_OPIVI|nr:hypothetical protein T265_07088 [Opisthorchis viverrini]KER25465.1 hypothetical protein T265_07088 [Opisthorchis viverrini]
MSRVYECTTIAESLTSVWYSSAFLNRLPEDGHRVETLALIRDSKRRSKSYRGIHTARRSYTEILREIIEQQTELLQEAYKRQYRSNRKQTKAVEEQSVDSISPVGLAKDNSFIRIGKARANFVNLYHLWPPCHLNVTIVRAWVGLVNDKKYQLRQRKTPFMNAVQTVFHLMPNNLKAHPDPLAQAVGAKGIGIIRNTDIGVHHSSSVPLGRPGIISALVPFSGGVAIGPRKTVLAERFPSQRRDVIVMILTTNNVLILHRPSRGVTSRIALLAAFSKTSKRDHTTTDASLPTISRFQSSTLPHPNLNTFSTGPSARTDRFTRLASHSAAAPLRSSSVTTLSTSKSVFKTQKPV